MQITIVCNITTLLISSNIITVISLLFHQKYPALVAFILLLHLSFVGLVYGLSEYHSLHQHQRSWKTDLQKYAIWLFYTAFMVGLVYEFIPFFGLAAGMVLFGVTAMGSVLLFHEYTTANYDQIYETSGVWEYYHVAQVYEKETKDLEFSSDMV